MSQVNTRSEAQRLWMDTKSELIAAESRLARIEEICNEVHDGYLRHAFAIDLVEAIERILEEPL